VTRKPLGPTVQIAVAEHWWSSRPARSDIARISTRRAYAETLSVFLVFFAASIALAGFTVGGATISSTVGGWREAIPGSIGQVATTVLAVGVPLVLASRRGLDRVDLGLAVRKVITIAQGIRMAAWAVLGLMAGSVVTRILATGHANTSYVTYPDLTLNLFHSAQAGFLEETVALAFVVTTLEQARRPLAEIVIVAVLLRASYHIYYGPGVAGILIWATVFVWLYLRYRSIVPLIAVHSTWDVLIVLTDRWHPVAGLELTLVVGLFVAAPVTWLVERDRTKRLRTGSPPLGWYPDPAGTGQPRWWTGTHWWPTPTQASPIVGDTGASPAAPGLGGTPADATPITD
jgi:membrane protease YdiL (CAAX protease family)